MYEIGLVLRIILGVIVWGLAIFGGVVIVRQRLWRRRIPWPGATPSNALEDRLVLLEERTPYLETVVKRLADFEKVEHESWHEHEEAIEHLRQELKTLHGWMDSTALGVHGALDTVSKKLHEKMDRITGRIDGLQFRVGNLVGEDERLAGLIDWGKERMTYLEERIATVEKSASELHVACTDFNGRLLKLNEKVTSNDRALGERITYLRDQLAKLEQVVEGDALQEKVDKIENVDRKEVSMD
jgi:chromosome segregation ATPase